MRCWRKRLREWELGDEPNDPSSPTGAQAVGERKEDKE